MLIECIIKRDGGTRLTLWGTPYHFEPDADGRHVADVTDPAHVERFLSIPEAYREAGDSEPKPAARRGRPRKVQPVDGSADANDAG
jgi:hypothetical protein